ncbi:MAG: hypothetical protein AB7Q97_01155 [Gammaproteobacteria bacterium]
MRYGSPGFAFAAAMTIMQPAAAAVLYDASPDTTGAEQETLALSNRAAFQNFVDRVTFATGVRLTGMAIFTIDPLGKAAVDVTVRIFADDGGRPGALVAKFTETRDARDKQHATSDPAFIRVHATFAEPVELQPGDYWFGMSGTKFELGLFGLSALDDNGMWLMSGDSPRSFRASGDMPLMLEGEIRPPASVPLPASAWLLAAPAGGLLARRVRPRRARRI